MRFAILADIHGNLPALEAVVDDLRADPVDGVLVAGDMLTGGPFPKETLALLRDLDACMIQGNTDAYLVDYRAGRAPAAWATAAQWAPVRWTCAQLTDADLDFLAALPVQRAVAPSSFAPLRMVHGALDKVNGVLVPDQDAAIVRKFREAWILSKDEVPSSLTGALAALVEAVLICGHTHIAWQARQDGWLALNPGSVGNAIDGNVGAEYALLTWAGDRWHADLRFIPYDLDCLRAAYHARGLLDVGGPMARAFLRNAETGHNFAWFLIQHAAALAQDAGLPDLAAFPDDLWAQAAESFDWQGGHVYVSQTPYARHSDFAC